ncbi:carbonic anhydrase-like [Amphibalanus amphitrite]|uniref:carbonic anhydrase-like n=1 Tax=Amphibalanus amphitrite TaxID=1232801 RepID=UPI001C901501|nr:carbonic anhydrase-like [Amphibalanus amphitrite]
MALTRRRVLLTLFTVLSLIAVPTNAAQIFRPSSHRRPHRSPEEQHLDRDVTERSTEKQPLVSGEPPDSVSQREAESTSSADEEPILKKLRLNVRDSVTDDQCADPSTILDPCDGYEGPRQSPIDIDPCGNHVEVDRSVLRFKNIDSTPQSIQLLNTGNRVMGAVTWANHIPTTISGGRLPGTFVFEIFDMHWGANNSYGSEHTINGYRYPAELHLGFRNIKYGSLEEAAANVDGLAGIAVFLDLHSGSAGRGIAPLAQSLYEIKEAGSSSQVASPPNMKQLLPKRLDRYVAYTGSPTAVIPCWGNVVWYVMLEPIRILERELELLRDLRNGSGHRLCQSTIRALQPVSSRRLYTKQRFLRCLTRH